MSAVFGGIASSTCKGSRRPNASPVPHPFPEFNSQATQRPWGTPYRPPPPSHLYPVHSTARVVEQRIPHDHALGNFAAILPATRGGAQTGFRFQPPEPDDDGA